MDFSDIATMLPGDRVATIRKELTLAVQGEFDAADDASRQPYQFQSQYWLTGAIHSLGVEYELPDPPAKMKKKAPDLVLPNGNATYGVEVKRPSSRASLEARLTDAHDQLTSWGVEGAAVVDVSDLLQTIPPGEFARAVHDTADAVNALVVSADATSMKPAFGRFMNITVFARGAWQEAAETPAQINMAMISSSTVFAVPGTLRDHRALWLRDTLQRALEVTARTSRERGEPGRWPLPADLA